MLNIRIFKGKKLQFQISEKIIRILILLPILTFVSLRIWQGFGYMQTYFKQVIQIVLFNRNESYEERQFQTMGVRYLYPKKMADVTPERSVICFWERNSEIDPPVDQYFLYPRIARTLVHTGSTKEAIAASDCSHIVLSNNWPDFDIDVKKVFLFGTGLEDEPLVLTPGKYRHNESIYKNRTGLLEL